MASSKSCFDPVLLLDAVDPFDPPNVATRFPPPPPEHAPARVTTANTIAAARFLEVNIDLSPLLDSASNVAQGA
jgi:hypothetical protein